MFHPILPQVADPLPERNCLQIRRLGFGSSHPLTDRQIGNTVQTDGAAAPRLRPSPLDQVIIIFSVLFLKNARLPLRAVKTTRVRHDNDIAVRDPKARIRPLPSRHVTNVHNSNGVS